MAPASSPRPLTFRQRKAGCASPFGSKSEARAGCSLVYVLLQQDGRRNQPSRAFSEGTHSFCGCVTRLLLLFHTAEERKPHQATSETHKHTMRARQRPASRHISRGPTRVSRRARGGGSLAADLLSSLLLLLSSAIGPARLCLIVSVCGPLSAAHSTSGRQQVCAMSRARPAALAGRATKRALPRAIGGRFRTAGRLLFSLAEHREPTCRCWPPARIGRNACTTTIPRPPPATGVSLYSLRHSARPDELSHFSSPRHATHNARSAGSQPGRTAL
jgi:hypothetical protein